MMNKPTSLVLILLLLSSGVQAQAEFGRFFTTPKQRDVLEESRSKRPQGDLIIDMAPETLPDMVVEEETLNVIDTITVNGLVYRTDGKNTAWINRNSTNHGSIENQYTRVDEHQVDSNQVRIILPGNQPSINLKVGQQYDVMSQQVYDIVGEQRPANESSLQPPEDAPPPPPADMTMPGGLGPQPTLVPPGSPPPQR